jgi:hypothetical protein
MLGLARLAWNLAQRRAYPFASGPQPLEGFHPVPRDFAAVNPEFFNCSSEYYRICDRITRSETP